MMGIALNFQKMPYKVVQKFAKLVDAEIIEHFRGYAQLEKWDPEIAGENFMFIYFRVERQYVVPKKSTLISEDKETGIRVYEKIEYRIDRDYKKTRVYFVYMPQPAPPCAGGSVLISTYTSLLDLTLQAGVQ